MPFNPNYEIPAGTLNPAVVGTPISAADWNAFITDLQAALTDTLRATTQAFVGQVEFDPTGDAGAPALSFTTDTDTGIFQKAANEVGISTGATERMLVKNADVDVTGALAVSGAETVGGNLGVTGDVTVTGDLTVTGTITSAAQAALVRSNSSGGFSHTGDTVATDIKEGAGGPSLSVTIVATGNPVLVAFQPIPWVADAGYFQFIATTVETRTVYFIILRDGVAISKTYFGTNISVAIPLPSLSYIDVPAAGSHTYKIQVQLDLAANTIYALHGNIVAYEL